MRITVWVILLLFLLFLTIAGEIRSPPARKTVDDPPPDPNTDVTLERGVTPSTRLFILLHGYTPTESRVAELAELLKLHGDVLRIDFPASALSNAAPESISSAIAAKIAVLPGIEKYSSVVFVAHSVGALIARRTLLLALGGRDKPPARWTTNVKRMVLLAGTNRGWSLDGQKPVDMAAGKRLSWRVGIWLGRLLGFGSFIMSAEAGAPFVANLRLDWMRKMHELAIEKKAIEVVQLLGDIDDIVSREDNEDLRVMASSQYAFLLVRGTGHGDIIEFNKNAKEEAEIKLGEYRKEKIVLAATALFSEVQKENEEQVYTTQGEITSVFFVLHGIRDLGRWSSEFEREIREEGNDHLAIVSPRYGYLGMGPFLLPSIREHYVQWFMDQYTETLAKYPNVAPDNIYFFGHSNGAYLLTKALEQYRAMHINRVVLAGSVVPKAYEWGERIKRGQVTAVRNYVGTDDWVVALFPRMFELWPFQLLRNDLGSSGFKGFDQGGGCGDRASQKVLTVSNVCYVAGTHGAFEGRVKEIVQFLTTADPPDAEHVDRPQLAKLLDSPISVWGAWILITGVVIYLGARLVLAAPSPSWVVLMLYILLVLRTLQTV